MLHIQKKRLPSTRSTLLLSTALLMFASGLYLMALVATPVITPYLPVGKIDVASLQSPRINDNRIIIPKIGVNIAYGEGEAALDSGAQWRYPDRGNPATGGNFIIAAHRFELAVTPQATLLKSPFYHIDKLTAGDEIIVDYEGTRYGYTVNRIYDVQPTQVEIEAPTTDAKMTLYTCTLGGATDGRVVIDATPLGEVTVEPTLHNNS